MQSISVLSLEINYLFPYSSHDPQTGEEESQGPEEELGGARDPTATGAAPSRGSTAAPSLQAKEYSPFKLGPSAEAAEAPSAEVSTPSSSAVDTGETLSPELTVLVDKILSEDNYVDHPCRISGLSVEHKVLFVRKRQKKRGSPISIRGHTSFLLVVNYHSVAIFSL